MDRDFLDTLKSWRRHLHAHPELSGQETQTAAFAQERLRELGVPFVAGVGGHGVVATLQRGGSGRSVGLRADMDALPITEHSGAAHASRTPGVMHACGHDGHTVSLLGAAAMLNCDPGWQGTVHFIFQPAEENGTGAKAMIADGLFQRFPMRHVFGFHNWPGLEAGVVAVHRGPVMAAGGRWTVTLEGLAGHAAKPHHTRDPIVAAGYLIVALQSIVSRNVDPLDSVVLSIGSIHGGSVSNQIPGDVTLTGTLRTYQRQVRQAVIARMVAIIEGTARSFGMRARHEILSTGRAIINTRAEADLAAAAAEAAGLTVKRDIDPSTAGDDFAFLLDGRPGAYVWIGNGPVMADSDLHNASYDFNDEILPAAVAWMSKAAKFALQPDSGA
jgi:amidohydrolase